MPIANTIGELRDALYAKASNGVKGALKSYLALPLDWQLPTPIEITPGTKDLFAGKFFAETEAIFKTKLNSQQQIRKFNAFIASFAISENEAHKFSTLLYATSENLMKWQKPEHNATVDDIARSLGEETVRYYSERNKKEVTAFEIPPPDSFHGKREPAAAGRDPNAITEVKPTPTPPVSSARDENSRRRNDYYQKHEVLRSEDPNELYRLLSQRAKDVLDSQNTTLSGAPRWSPLTVRTARQDMDRAILEYCSPHNRDKEFYGDPIRGQDFDKIVIEHANYIKISDIRKSKKQNVNNLVKAMVVQAGELNRDMKAEGIALPMHHDDRGTLEKIGDRLKRRGAKVKLGWRHGQENIYRADGEPNDRVVIDEPETPRARPERVTSIRGDGTSMLHLADRDIPDVPENPKSARVEGSHADTEPKLGFRQKATVAIGAAAAAMGGATKTGREWVAKRWNQIFSKEEVEKVAEETVKKGFSKNAKIALGLAAAGAVGYAIYSAIKPGDKWTDSVARDNADGISR